MSSSDHLLSSGASAPLFLLPPPITAASDRHYFGFVLSLFLFITSPVFSPSPRRPLRPPLSSPPSPSIPPPQKRHPPRPPANSLSYHRPRLKSLLHRILPPAATPPNPVQPLYPHSSAWRLKRPPLELHHRAFRNHLGPPRESCGPPPFGSQTRSTTSRASHR
ncbi:hypothetical protein BDV12DRAFT_61068 [Aspergillus spectabilis]